MGLLTKIKLNIRPELLKILQPKETQTTTKLKNALQPHNVFDTEIEIRQRKEILLKLSILGNQWIRDVLIMGNMPPEIAEKTKGKIYPFGSYRLGVHQKGADIDTLFLAPNIITRTDFFTSFFVILKKQPEVTECRAIVEAFVPIIKMKFDGIEIDLLFARLSLSTIPDNLNLRDNDILRDIDTESVRSLNGCRVTDEILSLVPNTETFSLALRAIKLWAKKQGIYSNSLGYFGGVTWAMLVAYTCQLFPKADAPELVHKFFSIFSKWKWPNPVMIKIPTKFPLAYSLRQKEWDPSRNISDRLHLMPIITPSYPQQNSTFNVLESTKKVIVEKLNQGATVVDDIMIGNMAWDRLFDAPSFFLKHRHLLALIVSSQTAKEHLEWCGFVESKIRLLIGNLQYNEDITLAHVNPKCFDLLPKHDPKGTCETSANDLTTSDTHHITSSPFCSMWFIGLQFIRKENLNVDLTESILSFTETIYHLAANRNILTESMEIEIRHISRKQLDQYLNSDFINQERENTLNGNNFNQKLNGVTEKRLSGELDLDDSSIKKRLIEI